MRDRSMPRSDLDLVDWLTRGVIATIAAFLVGIILFCASIGAQVVDAASTSTASMTVAAVPDPPMSCGAMSRQALAGMTIWMGFILIPFIVIALLAVAGAFAAMMGMPRN